MAPTPWRGRYRRRPKEGTRVSFRDAQSFRARSRRPERLGLDAVVFHLEVQGLVVHAQESRGLTLVPPRGLKGQADRLPLRLGGGPAGDLLQGGAHFFSQPSHHGSSTLATRGPASAVRANSDSAAPLMAGKAAGDLWRRWRKSGA